MTSNVSNQGVAHLAWRLGGQPLCRSRRGHISVTPDNRMGYRICKRCEATFSKTKKRASASEAECAAC